jgi:hypothetical protein
MSICDLGFALKFVLAGAMQMKLSEGSIGCYLSGFFGEFFLQVTTPIPTYISASV